MKNSIIANNVKVSIDSVFCSSWGYEQTNVTYYQVVDVKGKTTVVLREIQGEVVERDSSMSGMKKYCFNKFIGEAFTKRLSKEGNVIKIESYEYAYLKNDNEPESYTSWG